MEHDRRTYIECFCHDFEDLTRVTYDKEDELFDIEFRVHKFPGTNMSVTYLGGKGFKIWFTNFFRTIEYKLRCFKSYIINIKYAVFGMPYWFVANPIWDKEIAQKLVGFICDSVGEPNKFPVYSNGSSSIGDSIWKEGKGE